MDQGKLFWPNFWLKEPWINFDVGILPGKHWAQMWKDSSWFEITAKILYVCNWLAKVSDDI